VKPSRIPGWRLLPLRALPVQLWGGHVLLLRWRRLPLRTLLLLLRPKRGLLLLGASRPPVLLLCVGRRLTAFRSAPRLHWRSSSARSVGRVELLCGNGNMARTAVDSCICVPHSMVGWGPPSATQTRKLECVR
jgi:hypothetical protein